MMIFLRKKQTLGVLLVGQRETEGWLKLGLRSEGSNGEQDEHHRSSASQDSRSDSGECERGGSGGGHLCWVGAAVTRGGCPAEQLSVLGSRRSRRYRSLSSRRDPGEPIWGIAALTRAGTSLDGSASLDILGRWRRGRAASPGVAFFGHQEKYQ